MATTPATPAHPAQSVRINLQFVSSQPSADDQERMVKYALVTLSGLLLASVANATNWVGNAPAATDSACYRKTHMTKTCPSGYTYDDISTCWAECPLDYPVECGMECIPQNADCTTEIITKVASVATVALNAATAGVFGDLKTASAALSDGVKCATNLKTVITRIVKYANDLQSQYPTNTTDEIIYVLSRVDFVVNILPPAITSCLGLSSSEASSDAVTTVVTKVIQKAVSEGLTIVTSYKKFMSFMTDIALGSTTSSLSTSDQAALETLLDSNTTCGAQIQDVINQVVSQVTSMKTASSSAGADEIRLTISQSDLFLNDIPAVTTACMTDGTVTSYDARAQIRKALLVIIDQIIDTGDSDGTAIKVAEYTAAVADMALGAISSFDTTGLAALAAEYIQPICGPTMFVGEIDDGNVAQALGLTTDGKAFAGSTGTWTKSGDGVVRITFVSSDTKDVKVVIHSAGDTVDEVKVKSGETVVWTSTVAAMGDKTLYLDRWRPGFLGLPGSGGGSLLSWISRSSQGGHLELSVSINVS